MPNFPRTDLAVEAEAIHRSAAAVTELPGVRAEETNRRGFSVTEVHVLDAAGENALCKPIGDYYTLALDPLLRREDDAFENAAQTLAELLRGVLPLMPDASVLVVGLGNRAITPDAVGPDAIDSVMVTRHLREQLPEHFGQFRPVAALAAGAAQQLKKPSIKTVAVQLMRSPRFRRTALIVGGAAAVGTIGAVAARYRFYQTIVAQEVEKALKPVHAQLDDLQATVDAMAEAEGIEPEKTRKGKKHRR